MFFSQDRVSGNYLLIAKNNVLEFDRVTRVCIRSYRTLRLSTHAFLSKKPIKSVSCLVDRSVGSVSITEFYGDKVTSRLGVSLQDFVSRDLNYKNSCFLRTQLNFTLDDGSTIEQYIYVLGGI